MNRHYYSIGNKSIVVYDNAIPFVDIRRINNYVTKSFYSFQNVDENVLSKIENVKPKAICKLNSQDIDEFILNNYILNLKELENYKINRQYFNYSCLSDIDIAHVDDVDQSNSLTVLYYSNPVWDINWGGHTLFFNDSMTEIEYTSVYKPGRIIIFDPSIPHSAAIPNMLAKLNRYTVATKFVKVKNES